MSKLKNQNFPFQNRRPGMGTADYIKIILLRHHEESSISPLLLMIFCITEETVRENTASDLKKKNHKTNKTTHGPPVTSRLYSSL